MKFQVTYEDGVEATYKVKPKHLVRYEDEVGTFDDSASAARNSYALAHMASGTSESFDAWLDKVDDITVVGATVPGTEAPSDEAGEPVPTS